MKKQRRKQAKKKPTHQFGVLKIPKGAVVVDSGVIITDEQGWETDYTKQEPKDGEQSEGIHR